MRHIDAKLVTENNPRLALPATPSADVKDAEPPMKLTKTDVLNWMESRANATQTVRAAVEEVLEKYPHICRNPRWSLDVMWGNVEYWAQVDEISDQHQDLVRRYLASIPRIVNEVIERALHRGPRENATRIGFEIELAMRFTIAPQGVSKAEKLVNQTLAYTDPPLLEFVIDDIKRSGTGDTTAQGEFRTVALDRERLVGNDGLKLGAKIRKAIGAFPSVGTDSRQWKWVKTAEVDGLLPYLKMQPHPSTGGLRRLAQHVTHSIPLSAFVQLSTRDKELLIPGSGTAKTVRGLLIFFLHNKLDVAGETIMIDTARRNKLAPNPKSALETIIGLLNPEEHRDITRNLRDLPTQVKVIEGDEGKIADSAPLSTTVPEYPRFNPQDGRGYLSGEEKLKPVMADFDKRDFRILIEHRAASPLVNAVNESLTGQSRSFREFVEVFKRLDCITGGSAFSRWFVSAPNSPNLQYDSSEDT